VAARRIASDPVPMTTLRFRERRIGRTQAPSRPKAATEHVCTSEPVMTTLVWSARQTHPPGGDCRIRPKAGVQRLAAGIEDTFPRFVTFRRNQMGRSLHAGLPPQRLPLSGFLTLSAVLSRHTLVAVFQATSTHRLRAVSRAFPAAASIGASRRLLLSCHRVLPDTPDKPTHPRVSRHPSGKPDRPSATHRRRPWLQSFAPTGRPTLRATGKRHTKPLLS
jgi:hypothetical protein